MVWPMPFVRTKILKDTMGSLSILLDPVGYHSPGEPECSDIGSGDNAPPVVGESFLGHPDQRIRYAADMLLKKHISYEYENESRFIFSLTQSNIESGNPKKYLQFPLAETTGIVQKIVVSPYAKKVDFDGICRLCEKTDWNLEPQKSSLEIPNSDYDEIFG